MKIDLQAFDSSDQLIDLEYRDNQDPNSKSGIIEYRETSVNMGRFAAIWNRPNAVNFILTLHPNSNQCVHIFEFTKIYQKKKILIGNNIQIFTNDPNQDSSNLFEQRGNGRSLADYASVSEIFYMPKILKEAAHNYSKNQMNHKNTKDDYNNILKSLIQDKQYCLTKLKFRGSDISGIDFRYHTIPSYY